MKIVIIDASVALAWLLPDEKSSHADVIYRDFKNNKIKIMAPSIFFYEILSGIRNALLRKRIDKRGAKQLAVRVLAILPDFIDFQEIVQEAFQLSIKYPISIYDASYVALAQKKKLSFYTADQKLFDKIKKLPQISWLKNYKPN